MTVMIAVPTMGEVKVGFLDSLWSLEYDKANTMLVTESHSLVYAARQNLLHKAVVNECDYILWLDSDMTFPTDTLTTLLADAKNGKDFVTALCPRRAFPSNPLIAQKIEMQETEFGVMHQVTYFDPMPSAPVFEIGGSGFGCVLTRTQTVVDLMIAEKISPFTPLPGIGEDYSFCYRMSQFGKKMWCDARIKCGHIGEYIYTC